MRARNLARAIDHQRRQEQHAMDSSLLAAMASAGDESPGGDGTMNGDGLRAPLGTGAREPTPWFDRAISRDGLRAPLETGVREPTPWFDRANSRGGPRAPLETSVRAPTSWSDRANSGGGLRARFELGETDPGTYRDCATGDDRSRGSTEKSELQWAQSCGLLWALKVAIWCLDIVLGALQYMERRTREERVIQSQV